MVIAFICEMLVIFLMGREQAWLQIPERVSGKRGGSCRWQVGGFEWDPLTDTPEKLGIHLGFHQALWHPIAALATGYGMAPCVPGHLSLSLQSWGLCSRWGRESLFSCSYSPSCLFFHVCSGTTPWIPDLGYGSEARLPKTSQSSFGPGGSSLLGTFWD